MKLNLTHILSPNNIIYFKGSPIQKFTNILYYYLHVWFIPKLQGEEGEPNTNWDLIWLLLEDHNPKSKESYMKGWIPWIVTIKYYVIRVKNQRFFSDIFFLSNAHFDVTHQNFHHFLVKFYVNYHFLHYFLSFLSICTIYWVIICIKQRHFLHQIASFVCHTALFFASNIIFSSVWSSCAKIYVDVIVKCKNKLCYLFQNSCNIYHHGCSISRYGQPSKNSSK